jgi:Undecaprenyl-phosphate galactose phosphotransferase WbaP
MEPTTAAVVEIKLAGMPGIAAKTQGASMVAVRPLQTTFCLVAADGIALGISIAISAGIQFTFGSRADLAVLARSWPFFFVFLAVFAGVRLYSLVGLSAPEELRRSTMSSVLLLFVMIAVSASEHGPAWYREWPVFSSVALSIVLVPLLRAIVRLRFGRRDWWGYPAVVVGTGPAARNLIGEMRRDIALGLKPVAVIEDRDFPCDLDGLPVFGTTADPTLLRELKSPYVIAAVSEVPQRRILQMLQRRHMKFAGILLVQDSHAFSSLHITMRKIGGMFALELPREHALHYRRIAKRLLDLALTLIVAIPALPIALLIAAVLRLTSRGGPVLYGQRRIGRHGEDFKAWKFRSMIVDADQVLKAHLEKHPGARAEWEANHKLKNDPRITRIGAFLRKTSLDELPQLWNILMGQMSLVGPRPIVQAEVERYGECFELYKDVRGGLTGLWQVSGRNDTSYEERVRLDRFYVQNCSIWLDLCILFRTLGVVLLKKGAY